MGSKFWANQNLYYCHDPHVKNNSFLNQKAETTPMPIYDEICRLLPVPVWEGNSAISDCYGKTWQLAWRNLRQANPEAGFVSNYIDTAFSDYLFLCDSCFIVMFGKYASRIFDFQKTLDNFYSHQHHDGFICREIAELQPGEQWSRDDPASTGPNILPWAEWVSFQSTGDVDRLARVFDPLCAYHNWLRLHRSWPDGTYWSCGLACGMDNSPRQAEGYDPYASHGFMSWIDACAQQYLSASILTAMGAVLGREAETVSYQQEAEMLRNVINNKMWDEKTGFYYDTYRDGRISGVKTLASYWTMVAGLVPPERAERFVAHLDKEAEFKRPNRIPTLSADHPKYAPETGDYWRGGVWAPTNYMVLCGLHQYGYDDLAFEIARDYLNAVLKVFQKHHTVFENYAPESAAPGCPAKPDFVGWTGLAPISILFEYVFGIHPDAQNRKIIWNIHLREKHGVHQYPLGDATLDITASVPDGAAFPIIHPHSDCPVTLEVYFQNQTRLFAHVVDL